MNREFLKSIEGITDEAIESIMTEYGKGLQKYKDDNVSLRTENDTLKTEKEDLNAKLTELTNSSNENINYKAQLEMLQADIAEKERLRQEEIAKKEKFDAISTRFNTACGDKKFKHPAIKESYLNKFQKAIEDETNAGIGDETIFHSLTKDDADAFVTVQPEVFIAGAKSLSGIPEDDSAIRKIMGLR